VPKKFFIIFFLFTSCTIPAYDAGSSVAEWGNMLDKWGTLEDMVADGSAVKATTADLQTQIVEQFGKPLWMLGTSEPYVKDDFTALRLYSGGEYAVPMEWIEDFLHASPIDRWKSRKDIPFVCKDFSMAVISELNISPWYGVMGGIAWISGHSIVWFMTTDEIVFFEPQNDEMLLDINPLVLIR